MNIHEVIILIFPKHETSTCDIMHFNITIVEEKF